MVLGGYWGGHEEGAWVPGVCQDYSPWTPGNFSQLALDRFAQLGLHPLLMVEQEMSLTLAPKRAARARSPIVVLGPYS
jgi:hypothetical protein